MSPPLESVVSVSEAQLSAGNLRGILEVVGEELGPEYSSVDDWRQSYCSGDEGEDWDS